MRKKIGRQMSLLSILGVLVTTFCLTLLFYQLYRREVEDGIRKDAVLLAQTGIFEDPEKSENISIDIENARVTWIAADGSVLFDSQEDAKSMENHLSRPEVQSALSHGTGRIIRNSDTQNESTYYYAEKLDNGTVLRVATVTGNLYSILTQALPIVILICALIIALAIVFAHYLTQSLVKPIEKMAEEIGSGNLEPAYPELQPFAEQLRIQHEDILRNAKMRQDFTANVSHELKTPLTAISGYAELMENGMTGPDDTRRIAGEIRKNSSRLLSLITDILRLSQLDNFEEDTSFEEVDLNQIAETAVSNLKVNAQKHKITLSYKGTPAKMHGNKEMLSELVTNLVDNAIRYNYENGNVWIRVTTENGRPRLSVRDNGIGIPEKHQKRIFERFYRVDKSRSRQTGGTGLGLAIVKHIVMIHNANLTLESTPGVGTTIVVTF